jgi:hypothetical protein
MAQKDNFGPAQPAWKSHTGVKVWADISSTHLGRIKPKTSLTVHLRSTVVRVSRENKTAARPLCPKP